MGVGVRDVGGSIRAASSESPSSEPSGDATSHLRPSGVASDPDSAAMVIMASELLLLLLELLELLLPPSPPAPPTTQITAPLPPRSCHCPGSCCRPFAGQVTAFSALQGALGQKTALILLPLLAFARTAPTNIKYDSSKVEVPKVIGQTAVMPRCESHIKGHFFQHVRGALRGEGIDQIPRQRIEGCRLLTAQPQATTHEIEGTCFRASWPHDSIPQHRPSPSDHARFSPPGPKTQQNSRR